jgi:hypothetical protein
MWAVQFLLFLFLMLTHGPTTVYLAIAYLFAAISVAYMKRTKAIDCRINANVPMALTIMAGTLLTNPSLINIMKISVTGFSISAFQPALINAIGLHGLQTQPFGSNFLGMERLGSNYFLPETIRLFVLAASLAVTLWGIWRIVKTKKYDALNIFLIGGFFATSVLTAGNIIYPSLNLGDRSFLYLVFGGVLLMRNFIPDGFSFSGFSNFGRIKSLLKVWPHVLIAFLVLAPLANGIAYHYNNGINFSAPQYRDGYIFLVGHADQVVVFSHRDNHGMVFYRDTFWQRSYAHMAFVSLKSFDPGNPIPQQSDTCIIVAEPTQWAYRLVEMDSTLDGIQRYADSNMSRVYATTGYVVWYAPS